MPAVSTLPRAAVDPFVALVLTHARRQAQGWSGDRRAFISHVWRSIRIGEPEWQASDAEFKARLIEAHKLGQLTLAYADLKDKDSLQDVQESAISYMNTVWHYIRVPE